MSLLPANILPPGYPLGKLEIGDDGKIANGDVFIDKNWWLFLFNISKQVLATGATTTGVPSTGDLVLASVDFDIASGSGGSSSGGSVTAKQAVIVLPAPASNTQTVVVTDATVTASSKILLSLAGVPPTAVNESDDIDLIDMLGIPAAGSFKFVARFLNPISGPLTVNYLVG